MKFQCTHIAQNLWTAAKDFTNIDRPTDPVHQKITGGKTSIQHLMKVLGL